MKKNLEDFPELDKWIDDVDYVRGGDYIYREEVGDKLIELGNMLDRQQSKISELLFLMGSDTRKHFIDKWSEEDKTI